MRRIGAPSQETSHQRAVGPCLHRWVSGLFAAWLALACPTALAVDLAIRDDGATAGYVTLAWDADGTVAVELQQRLDGGAWRTLYRGTDTASTVSGLDDGAYQFRARFASSSADGPTGGWGQTLRVDIQHHPLSRALTFFSAGAAMFIVLLACVVTPGRDGTTRS